MSIQEFSDLLGSSNSNSQPKPSAHFNHQGPQENQFQHNNYPGLINNPNHYASSQAQFPLQDIHNTAQNVARKFLDLFQKNDEIKKTSNTQAGKPQIASNLRNAPQNLWNNSISSINMALSSLSISDDPANYIKDRSSLPKEENKSYHQGNELATRLNKAIDQNYVDPVILVNETFSKMKGCNPQFKVKQSISNANVLSFQCRLEYDSQTIGHGKGNSQKAARIEAAKQVLNVLLTNKQYSTERKEIDLYLDKKQPNIHNKKDTQLNSTEACGFDEQENDEKGSASYNLNEIAKKSFTQIYWHESPPMTANGGFKVNVLFDGLKACGEGKRKVDAKQKAAKKILEQIRINQKLINKYDCATSLLI